MLLYVCSLCVRAMCFGWAWVVLIGQNLVSLVPRPGDEARILYAGAYLSVVVANSGHSQQLGKYSKAYLHSWFMEEDMLTCIILWVLLCKSHYFTGKCWCLWGTSTFDVQKSEDLELCERYGGLDKGFSLSTVFPNKSFFYVVRFFPWVWLATCPKTGCALILFIVWPPQWTLSLLNLFWFLS